MCIQSVTKLDQLVQMSLYRLKLTADIWLLLRPAETRYPGRLNLILFFVSDCKVGCFVLQQEWSDVHSFKACVLRDYETLHCVIFSTNFLLASPLTTDSFPVDFFDRLTVCFFTQKSQFSLNFKGSVQLRRDFSGDFSYFISPPKTRKFSSILDFLCVVTSCVVNNILKKKTAASIFSTATGSHLQNYRVSYITMPIVPLASLARHRQMIKYILQKYFLVGRQIFVLADVFL